MGHLLGIFDPLQREISGVHADWMERLIAPWSESFRRPGWWLSCNRRDLAEHPQSEKIKSRGQHADYLMWDGRLDNPVEMQSRFNLSSAENDAHIGLAAYNSEGPAGLGRLIGDWSCALLNQRELRVTLASDFAGIRPLFYCEDAGRILWSSSLEQLSDFVEHDDLDEYYIAELLTSSTTGCRTPHPRIRSVPPGKALQFSSLGLNSVAFWSLGSISQTRLRSDGDYEEHFRGFFEEAVKVRLRSSRPVYSELSGGMDSSSITCMANRLVRQGAVKAPQLIAMTYQDENSNDEPFARAVRRHCDINSVLINVRSYPFISAASPGLARPAWWDLRHAEVVRQMGISGSSVLMSGQLGDLVMGNFLDDSAQVATSIRQCAWGKALQDSWAWSSHLKVPVHAVLWRAIRLNIPWTSTLDEVCPLPKENDDSLTLAFRKRCLSKLATSKQQSCWRSAPVGRRLRFRAVEETLESRALEVPDALYPLFYTHPFAHRPLVEFMLSAPAEIVCAPGEPRRLMRRALKSLLPRSISQRRSKASFNAVFASALRPLAVQMLGNKRLQIVTRGFADPVSLESRLRRFLAGLDCNEPQLRQLILLEFWLHARVARDKSSFATVA